MLPPLIVAHKERRSPLHRLAWRLIIFQIDLLIFDCPPQPFDKDVVQRPSPPVHTNLDPRCCQTSREVETGKLCPLITVEDFLIPSDFVVHSFRPPMEEAMSRLWSQLE